MIEKILVPLDGSTFAEHALPQALALASRKGASLHLAIVATPGSGGRSTPGGVPGEAARERGEAVAREYLDGVESRVRASGFEGEVESTVLPPGNAARTLVRHLVEIGAHFTVLTSHGRGAVQRAWLGSTADGFIRNSPEPVLLIRPRGNADVEEAPERPDLSRKPGSFSRVLVPLDGSKSGERLIPIARRIAGDEAALLLFRVVAPFTPGGSPYLPHVVREEQEHQKVIEAARGYLEGLAGSLRQEGAKAEASVVTGGQPAVSILRTVEEQGVDLVAMSTEGRGGVARLLLGSVADKVVRGSPVPVLLYRQPEAD